MTNIKITLSGMLITCATINTSYALDDGCIYAKNKKATALIDYSCVLADGDGTCASSGTGFIISPSGLMLTNNHVISPEKSDMKVSSETVKVRIGGRLETELKASIISRNKDMDLALLKLPPRSEDPHWPTVAISTTVDLPVGSPLSALGFSDSDLAVIPGGIKTSENTYKDGEYRPWWQTNLALNPGNSGGPVFGSLGTVVGIAVAYVKSAQLVSYIIPIYYAKSYLDLAGATGVKYASCANLPECRNKVHGIERYTVNEIQDQWSAWRSGGYSRPAYCSDRLTELKQQFPNSEFEFITDDEKSRRDFIGHIEYQYYCSFRRTEQPIYKMAKTEFCLP